MSDVYKVGLVGYPLAHSRSPEIWNQIFESEGISNISYHLFEVKEVEQVLQVLMLPDVIGVNVTIPHKQSVIPYLDELTDQARATMAVNTIAKTSGGKLTGHNTDVDGFRESLKNFLGSCTVDKAWILGTGGSAKAVGFVLNELCIEHTFISRTTKDEKTLTYYDLQTLQDYPKLIVNCTPLGMYPDVTTCPPIQYQKIKPGTFCFDLIYYPEMTIFLQKCKKQGAFVRNGLEMLHLQALKAWEFLAKKF